MDVRLERRTQRLRAAVAADDVVADVDDLVGPRLEREQRVEARHPVRIGGRDRQPLADVAERPFADPAAGVLDAVQGRQEQMPALAKADEVLEQALATHKRGLELARFCQQKLEAAQQQVKVLEGEVLKPLADAAEPAGESFRPDEPERQ
jgi:exodeoxyribonuclease VII small subunit